MSIVERCISAGRVSRSGDPKVLVLISALCLNARAQAPQVIAISRNVVMEVPLRILNYKLVMLPPNPNGLWLDVYE